MDDRTDIELMLRVRDGDAAAFAELARRYRAPLRRFFSAVLPDRSLGDDCAQETLLRLWLTRDRYEPTGRFSTYLFQIAKHYGLNERRKRSLPLRGSDEPDLDGLDGRSGPETAVLLMERMQRLRRAVSDLPAIYRTVFEMSHFEGLKYAEIARVLGVAVGTVKSRMSEAVRRLRAALEDEQGA